MELKVVIFWLLSVFSSSASDNQEQNIKCDYKDSRFGIPSLAINITYYACVLNTINLSDNARSATIEGTHRAAHSDDDVKYLTNYENHKLKRLSSIFCDKFVNIEAVAAYNMQLEFIGENALRNCRKLKHLGLKGNKFSQLPENLLLENTQLETLFITWNYQLTSLPEKFFASQRELTYLILNRNKLSHLPGSLFRPLVNLKHDLQLNDNDLELIDVKWFAKQLNLLELASSSNKLAEVPPKAFKNLKNLQKLWLGRNRIEILHADSFEGLESLETLSLWNNKITDLPAGVFDKLRNLHFIKLGANRLTTLHFDSFGSLPHLNRISLDENAISAIEERIIDATGVAEVDMTENNCADLFVASRDLIKSQLVECFRNYELNGHLARHSSNVQLKLNKSSVSSCGKAKVAQATIIGGSQVTRGAFPWHAALVKTDNDEYFCGGTLVTNRKVITAAHCIQTKNARKPTLPRDFLVVLGAHNLNSTFDPERRIFAVEKAEMNPDWNPFSERFDADIAVIVLEREVTFTNYIQPICLIQSENPVNLSNGVVIGYGKSEDDKKRNENIPKMLEMPIVDAFDCVLSDYRFGQISSKRTFCAGKGDGTGVCKGDSGGGMFVSIDGAYYLRGIVSASFFLPNKVCDVDSYSIFTDVLKFNEWIDAVEINDNL